LTAETLGKVYAVLARRRAKVQSEEVNEGSSIIVITAHLPAAESFGFAEGISLIMNFKRSILTHTLPHTELFAKTSGAASAQLELSHWEILDIDPNFVPTTEEELEEFGDNVGGIAPNVARKYIDNVRRRKVCTFHLMHSITRGHGTIRVRIQAVEGLPRHHSSCLLH